MSELVAAKSIIACDFSLKDFWKQIYNTSVGLSFVSYHVKDIQKKKNSIMQESKYIFYMAGLCRKIVQGYVQKNEVCSEVHASIVSSFC